MAEIVGINIKEVWDLSLSTASTLIVRESGTWVCQIWSKSNPDYVEDAEPAQPEETHDTGLPYVLNDEYDKEKLKVCFEWFKSRRDDYALPDIEKLKPKVAFSRIVEADLHEQLRGKNNRDGKVITVTYFADLEELMEAS